MRSRLLIDIALLVRAAMCLRACEASKRSGRIIKGKPMYHIMISAMLLVSISTTAMAADSINWEQLPDPAAQSYEDPFLDLSPDELDLLKLMVKLRERATSGKSEDIEKLAKVEEELKRLGVNADFLISQRGIVKERTTKAATAGNPKLADKEVSLAGFVIPAPSDDDGVASAYLVSMPGMCSHPPPPNPNLLVRLRLGTVWRPAYYYQPVKVSGRLSIDPSQIRTHVVDGVVPMRSTWRMDVADAKSEFIVPKNYSPKGSLLQ